MRPISDKNRVLNATFSVTGFHPSFEITFESGDGHGRNSEYTSGVERVLERLSDLEATLTEARISSKPVYEKKIDSRFKPKSFPLPLRLLREDSAKLRKALGNAGGRIESQQAGRGNVTRKMTLSVTLPGTPRGAEDLELELAGREQLATMANLADIDAAFDQWLQALMLGSRPLRGRLSWMDEASVILKTSPSGKRVGKLNVQLGVRSSGKPWSVEINSPKAASDPNGLVIFATNKEGRRFVLRQGRLRANPDSDGEIEGLRFRKLSGLVPVTLTGVASRIPRDWYVVADIDGSAEEIRRQTGDFVHACAAARLRSKGLSVPYVAPPTLAAEEKGGVFVRKAADAVTEKEILRLQGEVWLELRRFVERSKLQLVKLRHIAGYEVDGVIYAEPSNILIEIKTSASAADLYEGVGQLILYSRMLKLSDYRRILLLPRKPSATLVSAVEAEGLMILTYDHSIEGKAARIVFSDAFLSECGLSQ